MFYYHNNFISIALLSYVQLLPPMFLVCSLQVVIKYTGMTQEQPSLVDHITVVLILSSLQFSTRVRKFGILSQYRSITGSTTGSFIFLRKK